MVMNDDWMRTRWDFEWRHWTGTMRLRDWMGGLDGLSQRPSRRGAMRCSTVGVEGHDMGGKTYGSPIFKTVLLSRGRPQRDMRWLVMGK